MKVIYKRRVSAQVLDAVTMAEAEQRVIDKIELTVPEAEDIYAEFRLIRFCTTPFPSPRAKPGDTFNLYGASCVVV